MEGLGWEERRKESEERRKGLRIKGSRVRRKKDKTKAQSSEAFWQWLMGAVLRMQQRRQIIKGGELV